MRKVRWTRLSLKRRLKNLLRRPQVKLLQSTLHECAARADWTGDGPAVEIRVDTTQTGMIQAVIHELLHYHFRETFGALLDESLEEVLILALEKYLWDDDIQRSTTQVRNWRRLINQKLGAP